MNAALRRRARACYRHAALGDRLHVRLRDLSCPFGVVAAATPSRGRVLEVGCGHGYGSLLLALEEPGRDVVGIDIDADKVVVAQRAAEGVPNVRFEHTADGAVPPGPWDAVVIIDVLYLLGTERATALLSAAAGALAPGGRLVVKEIDERPRWKHRWSTLQELVSTRVLRITEGDEVAFVPPATIESTMRASGLQVARQRADRWSPWPHLLLTGER